MTRYDVIVVGDYFVDLIFNGLPQFPVLGKEIVGTGFDMLPGGAYNAALAMHRLGLRVGWAVDFGDDDFSRFVLACARAEGLDDTLFVHHRRPLRRVTTALSYPDDRAFITYADPDPGTPAALKASGDRIGARTVRFRRLLRKSVQRRQRVGAGQTHEGVHGRQFGRRGHAG